MMILTKLGSAYGSEGQEELLTAMDGFKRPSMWGMKHVTHHKLTFPTSSTSLEWWGGESEERNLCKLSPEMKSLTFYQLQKMH